MGAVALLRGEAQDWIGYGDGYGYGDGSGYGYGDGSGDGDGYGYGYGYGYGDGDGYGYGDGDGSGYGYGYGDGSGDGDGYGDGSYWMATIQYFAAKWNDAQRARLQALRAAGAKIAFWRSDSKGRPSNGGGLSVALAAPGVVHTESGPLNLCARGTLHATLIPPKWKGDRWWIVALIGEVHGNDEKYGALTREIIGECL